MIYQLRNISQVNFPFYKSHYIGYNYAIFLERIDNRL